MICIKELEHGEFVSKQFAFVVGECESYNKYFQVDLTYKDLGVTFGLQTVMAGIKPQVEIFQDKILIGAGERFYVYDMQGSLIKEYPAFCCFYEFVLCCNGILVIGELGVFFLNSRFEQVWEKESNEIIDIDHIEGRKLFLKDINGKAICLDLLSGREMRV